MGLRRLHLPQQRRTHYMRSVRNTATETQRGTDGAQYVGTTGRTRTTTAAASSAIGADGDASDCAASIHTSVAGTAEGECD